MKSPNDDARGRRNQSLRHRAEGSPSFAFEFRSRIRPAPENAEAASILVADRAHLQVDGEMHGDSAPSAAVALLTASTKGKRTYWFSRTSIRQHRAHHCRADDGRAARFGPIPARRGFAGPRARRRRAPPARRGARKIRPRWRSWEAARCRRRQWRQSEWCELAIHRMLA